jgi:hypothetical protein
MSSTNFPDLLTFVQLLFPGARVVCVEGSHDAIKHSFLPRENIVQHDYSKGPW